jgi:hypothetical protein
VVSLEFNFINNNLFKGVINNGEDLSEKERLTAGKVCCYLVKIGVSVYGRGVVHDL